MNNRLKIVISLPYLFSVRDFLFTPVWREMVKRKDVDFFLLCHDMEVGKLILERENTNVTLAKSPPLNSDQKSRMKRTLRSHFGARVWKFLFRKIDEKYLFDS